VNQYVALLIWGKNKKEENYFGVVTNLGETHMTIRMSSDDPEFNMEELMVRYSQIKSVLKYRRDSEYVVKRIGPAETAPRQPEPPKREEGPPWPVPPLPPPLRPS
jgi:hypothetical protein